MTDIADRIAAIAEIAEVLGCSIEDAVYLLPTLKATFGDAPEEQEVPEPEALVDENTDAPKEQEVIMEDTAKPSKIKCKCCGFYKKPRKVLVETGVCGVCTQAISDGGEDGAVEVIGRMGKRGRNSVSVMIDGRRWKVKRLSNRPSEKAAERARAANGKRGGKRKAHYTSGKPAGIPTNTRLAGDERSA